jgi:FeS assembly SUF system protein
MDDDLSLSDFIGSNIVLGEDKLFKAGKKNNNCSNKIDKNLITDELKKIFDPEIPVSIYDLGLIYKVDCLDNCDVNIEMSLTAPACPVAGELPKEVCEKVSSIDNVGEVAVKLVWDPAWTKDMMSEDAKLLLDIS